MRKQLLSISLPFTPYAVPVDWKHSANLTPNESRSSDYSNNKYRRWLNRKGEAILQNDVYLSVKAALSGKPLELPPGELIVSIEMWHPRADLCDADNTLAGLKVGFDSLALALGVDDSRFSFIIGIHKGKPRTVIAVLEDPDYLAALDEGVEAIRRGEGKTLEEIEAERERRNEVT